ncbi:MAG: hypothetical protein Q7S22_00145 [Candidatus Micrarchaeota archaeon]|nr:hypothetical protein [Candidatus Micrarchaeota archaeon]
MEMNYTSKKIIFNKELRAIDEFVFSFISYLDKAKIKYVIISGYVGLFFGRNRNTEDIDLFVEDLNFERFAEFWNLISSEFDCLNATEPKYAYDSLANEVALRFHKKDSFIPNIEFKPLKTDIDRYSLEKRVEIVCNSKRLYFSPLELQIAFKLELGSEKDEEDARFLYKVFKEHLNKPLLSEMLEKLNVSNKKFEMIIGEKLE